MLLAIDIGNTNIVCGLFSGEKLVADFRYTTRAGATRDDYWGLLSGFLHQYGSSFDGIVISSVVPGLTPVFEDISRTYLKCSPLVVATGLKTPLSGFGVDEAELGADRIVNATAGVTLYGAPLIIVDFGTATTFCVIDAARKYMGGAICPGVSTGADALFARASKLSSVELTAPVNVIGNNTAEALRSGIIAGHAAMVDGMLCKLEHELGCQATKIATGGSSEMVVPLCRNISTMHKSLILEGLNIIFKLNGKI